MSTPKHQRPAADNPAAMRELEGTRYHWGAPACRITVQSSDGYIDVHEGPGVDLDRILAYETQTETDLSLEFDRVVWRGERVVALIRFVEGRQPVAIRVEGPPASIPWTPGMGRHDDDDIALGDD